MNAAGSFPELNVHDFPSLMRRARQVVEAVEGLVCDGQEYVGRLELVGVKGVNAFSY